MAITYGVLLRRQQNVRRTGLFYDVLTICAFMKTVYVHNGPVVRKWAVDNKMIISLEKKQVIFRRSHLKAFDSSHHPVSTVTDPSDQGVIREAIKKFSFATWL